MSGLSAFLLSACWLLFQSCTMIRELFLTFFKACTLHNIFNHTTYGFFANWLTFYPNMSSFIPFDTEGEGRRDQIIADWVTFARRTEQPDTFLCQLRTCVVGNPRNPRPQSGVKGHYIEEISASRVLESNFFAFHSIPSSSVNGILYRIRWKTCIPVHLNACLLKPSSLQDCRARSLRHPCF